MTLPTRELFSFLTPIPELIAIGFVVIAFCPETSQAIVLGRTNPLQGRNQACLRRTLEPHRSLERQVIRVQEIVSCGLDYWLEKFESNGTVNH